MNLNEFQSKCFETAEDHGFHRKSLSSVEDKLVQLALAIELIGDEVELCRKFREYPFDIEKVGENIKRISSVPATVKEESKSSLTKLALIGSEVGEAIQARRIMLTDGYYEELADIVIRVGDLCGIENCSLENECVKKIDKNEKRPYMHGKHA